MRIRYGSVCSGIEAASVAWLPLGWEPVFFAEVEPFPCRVLTRRFHASRPRHCLNPDDASSEKEKRLWETWKKELSTLPESGRVPNLGDMTKIKGEEWNGKIDVLVGGTPCQSFSFAGNRTGLAGVSGLALSYINLLRTIRPAWFIWENVPGALSVSGGADLKRFFGEITECGYSVAWRVLDCQHVRVDGFPRAVPQQRRRLFAVGHLGTDWEYSATVLFDEDGQGRNPAPVRRARTGVARTLTASTGGVSAKEQAATFIRGDNTVLNPLCMATGQGNAEITEDRSPTLTCNHEAPLCFNWARAATRDMPVMEDISPTLLASRNSEPSVMQTICYENHAQDSRIREFGDVSPTIPAQAGTGGNNLPLVGETTEENGRILHMVRRFTPRETERLQGFPDDWTRIPIRFYPTQPSGSDFDKFRDLYEQCPDGTWVRYASDSPRYKACGNSMPVNVMCWLGIRIELVEEGKLIAKGDDLWQSN